MQHLRFSFSALRLALVALALCLLFSLAGSVSAAGTWEYIGSPGFSTFNIQNPALAFDSSGTPYVAFRDADPNPPSSVGKLTVKKFDGTNWVTVGSRGFTPTKVSGVTIAIDGTVPYVAYTSITDNKAKVMKFESGSWTDLNSSTLPGSLVTLPSLVVDAGTPYLAYVDTTSPSTAKVMKYVSGAWTAIGSFAAGYGPYSSHGLRNYGDTLYLAYLDSDHIDKLTVKKLESGTWSLVGAAGFSPDVPGFLSLALDGIGTPYVSFQDASGKATVMKFNGTSWGMVGSGVVSTGITDFISLDIDSSGKPYVGFRGGDGGSKATVMKFDGTSWNALGGAGFSEGMVQEPFLKVNGDTPYMVFSLLGSPYWGVLMKYDPSPTVTAFAASSVTDSFDIPITTFTATGDAPVVGYGITDRPIPPSAGSSNWSSTAPTTYTVPELGTYTLYPWVKDSANRVSRVYGSPVTVQVTASAIVVGSDADSGPGSLRSAISNSAASGVITFDDDYTIELDSPLTIDRDLTIDGTTNTVILDGQNTTRVIEIIVDRRVSLRTLTIRNGSNCCDGGGVLNNGHLVAKTVTFTNNHADYSGALANFPGATLTVTGSTFSSNSANISGGAIYNWNGDVDITTTTFSSNSADSGGAIFNDTTGTLNITDSTLENNTADDSDGGAIYNLVGTTTLTRTTVKGNIAQDRGGGIKTESPLNIIDSIINENNGVRGAGVFNLNAPFMMAGSSVTGNTANEDGGGIYNEGSGTVEIDDSTLDGNKSGDDGGALFNDTGATLNVRSSTLSNNTADNDNDGTGNGGALYNRGKGHAHSLTASTNHAEYGGAVYTRNTASGDFKVTNSTISGNTAAQDGGGIYTDHTGTLEIANVTLSDNTAPANRGGGISHSNAQDPSSVLALKNSIIANSVNGADCKTTGTVTGKNSLIKKTGADACNLTDGANGNLIGREPRLVPLALNGGSNKTHKLENDSPAIDAGDQTTCDDAATVNKLDQRSKARDDLQCDIGGFELTGDDSNTVELTPQTGQMRTFGPVRAGIKSEGATNPLAVTITRSFRTEINIIPARWNIGAQVNTGLNVTLDLCYTSTELGSVNENNLKMYRKPTGGSWSEFGTPAISVTGTNRCARVTGVGGFSEWALGTEPPAAPTATALVRFRSRYNAAKQRVRVGWQTGSELEIVGFNLWRKTGNGKWVKLNDEMIAAKHIGELTGDKYARRDAKIKTGKTYYYKLELVHAGGSSEWSDEVKVKTKSNAKTKDKTK